VKDCTVFFHRLYCRSPLASVILPFINDVYPKNNRAEIFNHTETMSYDMEYIMVHYVRSVYKRIERIGRLEARQMVDPRLAVPGLPA